MRGAPHGLAEEGEAEEEEYRSQMRDTGFTFGKCAPTIFRHRTRLQAYAGGGALVWGGRADGDVVARRGALSDQRLGPEKHGDFHQPDGVVV